jgi:hypothetical protein
MVVDPAMAGLWYGIQACPCCMVHARANAGGAGDCHKGVRGDLHAAHGGPRRAVAPQPQVPQLAALPGHKHPRCEAWNGRTAAQAAASPPVQQTRSDALPRPGVDNHRGDVVVEYMAPVRAPPACHLSLPKRSAWRAEPLTPGVCAAKSPPKGKHRYVFLLFKQSSRVAAHAPHARQSFTVRDFARQHALGDPVAARYFIAQPE